MLSSLLYNYHTDKLHIEMNWLHNAYSLYYFELHCTSATWTSQNNANNTQTD